MALIVFINVYSSTPAVIAAYTGQTFPDRIQQGDILTIAAALPVKLVGITWDKASGPDDWNAIVTLEKI